MPSNLIINVSKRVLSALRENQNTEFKLDKSGYEDFESLMASFLDNEEISWFKCNENSDSGNLIINGEYKGTPFSILQVPGVSVKLGMKTYKSDLKYELIPLILGALPDFEVVVAYDDGSATYDKIIIFADSNSSDAEKREFEKLCIPSDTVYFPKNKYHDHLIENVYFKESIPTDGNSPRRKNAGLKSPLISKQKQLPKDNEGDLPSLSEKRNTFDFRSQSYRPVANPAFTEPYRPKK